MFNTRSSNSNSTSEYQFLLSYIVAASDGACLRRRNGSNKCSLAEKKERNSAKQYHRCFTADSVQRALERRSRSRHLLMNHSERFAYVFERKTRFDGWYNFIIISMYQLQMKIKHRMSARAHTTCGEKSLFPLNFMAWTLILKPARLARADSCFLSFSLTLAFGACSASLFSRLYGLCEAGWVLRLRRLLILIFIAVITKREIGSVFITPKITRPAFGDGGKRNCRKEIQSFDWEEVQCRVSNILHARLKQI